jgi:hypothetical protein
MSELRDHSIMEVIQTASGKRVKMTGPEQILAVDSKEELMSLLQHYSRPMIRHVVSDSDFARRQLVEKIRPALRYYCARFKVPVPKWLVNEDYYHGLPDDEKQQMFGTTHLTKREFTKVVVPKDGAKGQASGG